MWLSDAKFWAVDKGMNPTLPFGYCKSSHDKGKINASRIGWCTR